MIKNIDDINAALDYVREENENFPKDFADKMDADSYNLACRQIEYQLNVLYEKIRLLQDIDEFARSYAEMKIAEKEEKLRDSLKIIEDVADLYHDGDSIAMMVPMQSDGGIVRDRDGAIIPSMQQINGKLVMDTNAIGEAAIAYVSNSAPVPCYNSSYANLVNGKHGMSTYMVTDDLKDGLVETISVDFARTSSVNYVSVAPVNAEITNVRGIRPNHMEVPLDIQCGYFAPQEFIGIKFDLVSKNYELATFYTDALAYDTSSEFFYSGVNTHADNNQTIKQMEESMSASERKYLADTMGTIYSAWDKFNRDVRNRNIKIEEGR